MARSKTNSVSFVEARISAFDLLGQILGSGGKNPGEGALKDLLFKNQDVIVMAMLDAGVASVAGEIAKLSGGVGGTKTVDVVTATEVIMPEVSAAPVEMPKSGTKVRNANAA